MKANNKIEFCIESYKEEKLADERDKKRFADISKVIRILIKNGYQLKVWSDELTVVIEYDFQDESMTGTRLEWLDEYEHIERNGEEYDV